MQNLCCALIKLHLSLLFINNIAPAAACSNVIKIYPDFIWQEKIMIHIREANIQRSFHESGLCREDIVDI